MHLISQRIFDALSNESDMEFAAATTLDELKAALIGQAGRSGRVAGRSP